MLGFGPDFSLTANSLRASVGGSRGDSGFRGEVVRLRTLQARERLGRIADLRGMGKLSLELSERQMRVAPTALPEVIASAIEETVPLVSVPDDFRSGDPSETKPIKPLVSALA